MAEATAIDLVCVVSRESSAELVRYGAAVGRAWQALPESRRGATVLVANGAAAATVTAAETALAQATGTRPERIESPTNEGFARAANRGFAHARGAYVALLDPDGAPEPDLLVLLAAELDATGDAAVASGSVVAFDEEPPPAAPPHDEPWCPGGASLYRRTALERLGGFDELFRWYCEDMDFGHRARDAGYRCRRVPGAVFRHPTGRRPTVRRVLRFTEYSLVWRHVHFGRLITVKSLLVQLPLLWSHNRGARLPVVVGGVAGMLMYVRHIPAAERRR